MALKKYRLKNIGPGHTHLFIGGEGYVPLNDITDELADKLYSEGKTNHFEPISDKEVIDKQAEKKAIK